MTDFQKRPSLPAPSYSRWCARRYSCPLLTINPVPVPFVIPKREPCWYATHTCVWRDRDAGGRRAGERSPSASAPRFWLWPAIFLYVAHVRFIFAAPRFPDFRQMRTRNCSPFLLQRRFLKCDAGRVTVYFTFCNLTHFSNVFMGSK